MMPERQTGFEQASVPVGVETEVQPMRKSIQVRAGLARTFRVFTEEMDSWWPRTHHIGSSPMKRVVVEGREGSIYIEQEDGTDCLWDRC
jgi:hypothetical protein